MKTPPRFWIGTGAALLVGIPCALLARMRLQPITEAEHFHGGDPKLEADLARLSGAERLAHLRLATQDSQPTRRLAAAEALASEQGAEGLALAKELLTDNDSEVRIKAAYALTRSGSERARPFLRAALRDDDLWVRQEVLQWAATNAGRSGNAAGSWLTPELVARLEEPSDLVRTFATSALAKLTGKPWRFTARLSPPEKAAVIKKWKDWWRAQEPKRAVAVPNISPRRTDPAPTTSFQTTEGKTVSPATSGKVTLLNFWGTWCAPCRQEVPELQKLHERFGPQGLEVIGIALSEKDGASGLRAWCKENRLTYTQVLGEDLVAEAYGDIHEVPISVLLDRRGRIRYRWRGERDMASFTPIVERLLQE